MVKICDPIYSNNENKYNEQFKKFPYELDHFQKWAIQAIEENKSVLVTAHTGSGKSNSFEYAIEKFCTAGKKVIYTSPIKSLSNQKFHELSEKFPNISFGILTGDIKFNPEADCLIMTTEILRNTLYQTEMIENGSLEKAEFDLHFDMDIQNELACVVFDEVHYINDADRGKVWEECIMKLPNHIPMVMLSATIDKPENFAGWIENIKGKEVYLTGTDKRVVPLNHYMYNVLPKSILDKKIKDKEYEIEFKKINGSFVSLKEQQIYYPTSVVNMVKLHNYAYKNYIKSNAKFVLNTVIEKLYDEDKLPAIVFVFSRKKVEEYAAMIEKPLFKEDESHYPSIIEKECKKILMKMPNYKEYLNLPEYQFIVKLLEKGIAIHHSGVIPVLREMIEIMFSKGFIKLLFATETFAIGINMPTKTVIFTSLTKYSDSGFRYLFPHEYTQMAGRAGRRGLDQVGHVIHLNNMFDIPSTLDYNFIMNGSAQTLESKFRISCNLVLNVLSSNQNCDETKIIDFVKKSMLCQDIQMKLKSMKNEQKSILSESQVIQKTIDEYTTKSEENKKKLNDVQTYIGIEEKMNFYKNKQRKKAKMQQKVISDSMSSKEFNHINGLLQEFKKIQERKYYIENRISDTEEGIRNNVFDVLELLLEQGYINSDFTLTKLGMYATHIQEVNCLAFSRLYNLNDENKCLDNLTVVELILFLSLFTNVRVNKDVQCYNYNGTYSNVKYMTNKIVNYYNECYDFELKKFQEIDSCEYEYNFDLIHEIEDWIHAENEEEAKAVIYKVQQKGLFVGEFIKALMKILNLATEMEKICNVSCNIELKHKLSLLPDKLMKFIACNQSLYV